MISNLKVQNNSEKEIILQIVETVESQLSSSSLLNFIYCIVEELENKDKNLIMVSMANLSF